VDSVPDPLLLRKSTRAGIEPGTSGSVARNSEYEDHRGGLRMCMESERTISHSAAAQSQKPGIVRCNPSIGMDAYPCSFCTCIALSRRKSCDGLILIKYM
jgi:hypothetical protein